MIGGCCWCYAAKSKVECLVSSPLVKQDVYSCIAETISPVAEEIDLRQAAMDYEMPKNRKEVKLAMKQKFLKVVKAAGVLIFNLDDSPCKYRKKYDPDYKEFYDRSAIHQHIWDPEQLLRREVWAQYSGSEELPARDYSVSRSAQ
eukprot:TRINITY_DN3269_c0_g1_i6.p2 TRINITY_DN3269_c0_g1~~TRINITY_DN3269_c0_g1_i6.p2  ORF type:complete len:145 (+),score=35.65 TRINITY_DN3269_c0_g1_i6:678-1112(+)